MQDMSLPQEQELFHGSPAPIGSVQRLFLAIVTFGIAWLYFKLKTSSTHFRITTQRIVIQSGLLSKRVDALELYCIDDIELEKPFGQRLLGTGNMVLFTQDKSNPTLRLERLPVDVYHLYEQLRPHIEQAKHRYRILRDMGN